MGVCEREPAKARMLSTRSKAFISDDFLGNKLEENTILYIFSIHDFTVFQGITVICKMMHAFKKLGPLELVCFVFTSFQALDWGVIFLLVDMFFI
jgi:hypothetical protein